MVGRALLVGLAVLVAGCWADFPDSRFNQDGSKDLPWQDDVGPQPDTAPPADGPTSDVRPADLPLTDQQLADGPLPDTQVSDTSPGPDLGSCPTACSSCKVGGICVLPCATGCTCPAGWSCEITCGPASCTGKIDCSAGTDCSVTCGDNACTGEILCGTGVCNVDCQSNACQGKITCGQGFCDVDCAQKACAAEVTCASSCGCAVDCHPTACGGGVTCPQSCGGDCKPQDGCDNC